jgi:outer membrane protein assembly factor BamE (lipoprotein component of BamABCDE complex)
MQIVCAALVVIVMLGGLHVFLLDGLDGFFFGLSNDESTHYAQGYSDNQFRRVRSGMREAEVFALLGEPLSRYPVRGERTGWLYSERGGDGDYRVRVIIFREGEVTERISEYYVD